MDFNDEQKLAINHIYGPCVVVATPGSGKTGCATERVVNLIKNHRINPGNILDLTFTNKASQEMRERIEAILGETLVSPMFIGTFHSFCLAVLRKYGHIIGIKSGFSIYDDKDQNELISKIARMMEYECKEWVIKDIARIVNTLREDLEAESIEIPPSVNRSAEIEKDIIKEYLQTLDKFNAVDFSGILYKVWLLFEKSQQVVDILSSKFNFILIDEVQDTNIIQYEIIRKIAAHGNLFVVGDPAQSIFEWRGACPENINKIYKDFENVKTITLPKNYRSTTEILAVAERLIRNNKETADVRIESTKGHGQQPTVNKFYCPDKEADQISQKILRLKSKGEADWKDCAVLYRTNQQSKCIEVAFRKANVPYKIVGGFSFFDRKEIKACLSYLSVLANPFDTVSFSRAISEPKRGVGDSVIGKLERFCQEDNIDILQASKRVNEITKVSATARNSLKEFVSTIEKYKALDEAGSDISTIASGILKDSGYYKFLQDASVVDDSSKKRIDNIDEFLLSIAEYVLVKPKARIADYLQSVKTLMDYSKEENSDNVITMLTMHSAKGLEFENVFIVGAEQGIIPHKISINQGKENEERRLMYVAATRAKKRMFISYCENRPQFVANTIKYRPAIPSQFLGEMFEDFIPTAY